jgi:protein tyrosine phosphatase (PTP) superfamily phosphohydrolase (DUF442 family)
MATSTSDVRDSGPAPPRSPWRRALGSVRWLVLGYAAAVACFHVLVLAGTVATRALGHDPRRSTLGTVQNLRPVDDRVWASGQPNESEYRALAARGLRLVVDLRSGVADDPILDDPALLAEMDVARLHLPVADGQVPTRAQIDEAIGAIRRSEGLALLHCGGGVGRSGSAGAAYLAGTGQDPSLFAAMAVGPMTLEQLWYVATARAGHVPAMHGPVDWTVSRISGALDLPRRALAKARAGDPLATAGLAGGAIAVGVSLVTLLRRGQASGGETRQPG